MVTRDNRKIVLVVDDNKDAADTMALLLSRYGCCAFAAYTTEDGLRLANEISPDIIFHDIGMPMMDGYAAVRLLRANPKFAATLIVAISAYSAEEFHKMSIAAGFDYHLTK